MYVGKELLNCCCCFVVNYPNKLLLVLALSDICCVNDTDIQAEMLALAAARWFLPGCPREEPAAKSCCCQQVLLGLSGEESEPCPHFGAFSFLLWLQKTWGH